MVRPSVVLVMAFFVLFASSASAQQAGSIRGVIYDEDFDAPLGAAEVTIAEIGLKVESTAEGNYVFGQVPAGKYTLVFSKSGYARMVKADVLVSAGRMTEVSASLAGDFTEMEEFVVQDIQIGGGSEAALLELRMDSPALMDSISADLMSQAGASDAAAALNLVSGASVQDGKYAVVRGLPDRYVNSQMNGVRLPTADADKRAVQLDQFPSAAIESIQVSKTFTPDQQGDASGGAVNVILKGVPEEATFDFSVGTEQNTNVASADFLSYKDGGVSRWGMEKRDIPNDMLGESWEGAAGVSLADAPTNYKWSLSAGGKYQLSEGIKIGGFSSFFYEQDSSFYDNGIQDKMWVEKPGDPMTPQYGQGTPSQGDFKTSLFDVTKGSTEVKWGSLNTVGLETENNSLSLTHMYTRSAEDAVTLAEDTRGKEYYFPGYDPNNPKQEGNQKRDAAPYLRTETLQYTERITQTMQLHGEHKLPFPEFGIEDFFMLQKPEFDWTISNSSAELIQPDKRQFGSIWWADSYFPGFPPYVDPFVSPAVHRPYKPAANFTLGNMQRIWKEIEETSDQYAWNLKLPFNQWTDDKGYLKFGVFSDEVVRDYHQESFSNFNDNSAQYVGDWDHLWSDKFTSENHPITEANIDVDYLGEQNINAWYYMADVPLTSWLSIIGGTRYENTELSIINSPEEDVTWLPPDAPGQVKLNAGDADVQFEQSDILPSLGFVLKPLDTVTLRGSYSETVARQTFKELTPIQQQEFLGGDVFIGNPFLEMSALKNKDLRMDWTPTNDTFFSVSYFTKDIEGPIEYVQKIADFPYTTAVNYPEGQLNGYELEVRQGMGRLWSGLEGLTLGANSTFINSVVTLPDDEAKEFEATNIKAPMYERDMTNAPEYLYNLYLTYEMDKLGLKDTQLALFYTVKGDTLIAGAGQSKGKFIPNVYEKEVGMLNLSLSKKFGDHCKIKFSAKNLLDAITETVYRSDYLDEDVTRSSYQKGMSFSLSIGYSF